MQFFVFIRFAYAASLDICWVCLHFRVNSQVNSEILLQKSLSALTKIQ